MANGITFGRVLAIKDYSILLDDGNFYGARDMVNMIEEKGIGLKDYVLISYWTKATKNEDTGKWINFRNVRRLEREDPDVDLPRLAHLFDQQFDYFDLPVREDMVGEADVDSDMTPF